MKAEMILLQRAKELPAEVLLQLSTAICSDPNCATCCDRKEGRTNG